MTTATGHYELDFSVVVDVDPYTHEDFDVYSGAMKIVNGALFQSGSYDAGSPGAVLRYKYGSGSGIMESKVEQDHASGSFNDETSPCICDTSGNGYVALVNGSVIKIHKLIAWEADTGTTIYYPGATTYAIGDVISLTLDVSDGTLKIWLNGVQQGGFGTEPTYATGLSQGVHLNWSGSNTQGAVSFAADGVLASGLNATATNAPVISGASITITGSNFGAQGTIKQSGIPLTITDWQAGTATATTQPIESTAYAYGAQVFTITNAAAETDTISGPLNPPSGSNYVNIASVLAELTHRLTALPDFEVADQVRIDANLWLDGVETNHAVTLNDDLSFQIDTTNDPGNDTYTLKARAWSDGLGWGAEAVITVVIFISEQLIVNDMAQSQSSESPTVTARMQVSANALMQTQEFPSITILPKSYTATSDLTHAQSSDVVSFVTHMVLTIDPVLQVQTQSEGTLTTISGITPFSITTAQSMGAPSLNSHLDLFADDITNAQTTSVVAFAIGSFLTAASLEHTQVLSADNVTGRYYLVVSDFTQAQQLEVEALLSKQTVTVDDFIQSQVLEGAVLARLGAINVDDITNAQILEALQLGAAQTLTTQDIEHSQVIAVVQVSSEQALAVDGLNQDSILTNASMSTTPGIEAFDMLHNQTAGSVGLVPYLVLSVENLSQDQTLEIASWPGIQLGLMDGGLVFYIPLSGDIIIN